MDNNEPIVDVDFNNLSFEERVVLSAFFDSEGNQYERIHDGSPSFVEAANILLSNKDELSEYAIHFLFPPPDGYFKEPDVSEVFQGTMERMGFDVLRPRAIIDGEVELLYLPMFNESLDIPTSRLNFETVMVHNDDKQALRIYAAQLRKARGCSLPTDSKMLSKRSCKNE